MTAQSLTMAGTLPDIERVREAKAMLSEAGVRYVLACWIDLLGVPKTKPVPLSNFEDVCMGKGPQFAVHSVSFVPELTAADSDQIPVPDLDTLVVCPWDRTCAWMVADLWWEDAPYNLCPRQALKRVVRDAAAKGYAGFAGIEPEFIAMRWQDGQPVKAFDDDPLAGEGVRPRRQAFGYDAEYSIDSMGFLGALIDILEELGWGLKDVVAEGAYSQFELDFGYTDVLRMADRLVFLRVLLKEVATAARDVHHLHAEAHHRRLAFGSAHQLLDAADRRPGGEPLRGRIRRRLGKFRVQTRSGGCSATAGRSPPSPARRSTPTTVWCPGSAGSRVAP